ncbi:hypothetical protein RGQ29_029458 [Quercus rubra]|uniref:(S)-ureidoglycine aminohydrolase cupin domain-containing protein n=1 Tax=Quercus rubra TaxID=3512 RepID=A0AAN7EF58_QUERU|nr:hypothetical protein RGQ29_029458 [Quercus rubra]
MSPIPSNKASIVIVVAAVVVVVLPLFLSVVKHKEFSFSRSQQSSMATEKFGVKIQKNPPESKLTELGVRTWPKWGCGPSKFPWEFTATETMFLLDGKVKVYVDGYDESFEIGAGDLVVFPKGMKVTWDVTKAVNKHYSLEK